MFVLLSPLAGWVSRLEEAPDEAFAGKLLGDGVAIDPIDGELRAPCDGAVISVAATGHAVAIRGLGGAEVLLHVGVDTVALRGEGFQVHVAVGQAVRAGDPLVTFDLDRVARGARSLITPVLIGDIDRFEIVQRAHGPIRAGDVLLAFRERVGVSAATGPEGRPQGVSVSFVSRLSDGVHARPAARIVIAAREAGVEITVVAHGRSASALSALGLMGLGVRQGDTVTLHSDEPLAPGAIAMLKAAFGAAPESAAVAEPPEAHDDRRILRGTRGAPGLAMGEAFHLRRAEIVPPAPSGSAAAEMRALKTALVAVRRDLAAAAAAPGPGGDILRAHLVLLDDPMLGEAAAAGIGGGASAGAAWRAAIQGQADLFATSGDARLQDRRADLLDLERQVLVGLYGAAAQPPEPPAGAIVLADKLLPSELSALAGAGIAGVAMAGGGATSHVAIMAAAMSLPMLTAVAGLESVAGGAFLILDADAGRLTVGPDAAVVAEVEGRRERRRLRRLAALAAAAEPCVTADGRPIAVFANLGGPKDARRAVAEGAEGCGLLRSEFLFQDRSSPPDEDEQHAAYQAVADRLGGRPLTIRTLDIGADKPAAYLALPQEQNPALGVRGVRVSLCRPDLLRIQVRAILRVRGAVAILVPMVASRHEIASVRGLLEEEAAALGVMTPPLGVMVETPAAALTVATLGDVAEFFSLGTNDLTQYVLAMDRTQPMLAAQIDGLHPAVVTLMRLAANAATVGGRKVSVCGGLAADHAAIPLLIGLGVSELSAPPGEIAEIKTLIRTLSAADCRAFAESGQAYDDAAALRRAVAERWPQVGDAP